MSKHLLSKVRRVLEEHGEVTQEVFVASDPRREGVQLFVGGNPERPQEPDITVTIDDMMFVEIHIPNAPNPLFGGEHSFEYGDMSDEDISEEIRCTIEDALDGPEG